MRILPKWCITNKHPAFYDAESATAIEQTAKLYAFVQEMAEDYNKFVDDINKAWGDYKEKGTKSYLEFQMKMEQLYSDFVKVIEMKYQSQDVYLQNSITAIIESLPEKLKITLNEMYTDGEFDLIVYNSIANLKTDFDRIVANTNTFQSNMNASFSNLATDMNTFKSELTADFDTLEAELTEKFDELVLDSQTADMQKAIYDTDNDGIVDDAEKLGGQLPEYYAKQQDMDTVNVNLDTMNISIASTLKQIETVQETANKANSTANTAKTTADAALETAQNKLGKAETAADSLKLAGKAASEYASAANGVTEYTHGKTGVIHYLNGSGNNIKFVANADFKSGDIFYLNGSEVPATMQNGAELVDNFFVSGATVICYYNGVNLTFSGGSGSANDIIYKSFSGIPVSTAADKNVGKITLQKGVWIIQYGGAFVATAASGLDNVGLRKLFIHSLSEGGSPALYNTITVPALSYSNDYISGITVVNATEDDTNMYLFANQTSGGDVSFTGYLRAIRL